MVKDWDHIIEKNEIDDVIKNIVKIYGAAFVKPLVFNNRMKVIAFFKNEDGLMRALRRTIMKNPHNNQWQVRIQDEKFKRRAIRRMKKTKKDTVLNDGKETGKKKGKQPSNLQEHIPRNIPSVPSTLEAHLMEHRRERFS
ncbi:hypothetical protein RclHR1_26190001 [Rhizophagus clarus]|uniref:Uncharacterized protein n=1 Tax=Rhizophagus clarus TaxID=94130 RepID=A0A2Z6R046_9GLOM|nr:hypothetical protein RclHR1_26190001 [Rhizophagus clarus]